MRLDIPLHDSVPVIPGFLNLAHVRNTRRGVRVPERRGLSAQAPLSWRWPRRSRCWRSRSTPRGCRRTNGWRASAWRSSWAAPSAT
ncbi:MAG: hypothetical protein M0C28_13390 [Candidatus Moduliflexus flocculans]|nr:hypothetical protein [Candidatus Moduliflexus flocculans]